MSGILCGLMVVMLMNLEIPVQNRDGACFIVPAAILNVPTQTQQEDVLLASQTVKYGLVQRKYRSVQDITMPLHTRSAVSAVPESNA